MQNEPVYVSGFGNEFRSQAIAGALPIVGGRTRRRRAVDFQCL